MQSVILVETFSKDDLNKHIKTLKGFTNIFAPVVFIRRREYGDTLAADLRSIGKLPFAHQHFVASNGELKGFLRRKNMEAMMLLRSAAPAVVPKLEYNYIAVCEKCERVFRQSTSQKSSRDIEETLAAFQDTDKIEVNRTDKVVTVIEYESGCC